MHSDRVLYSRLQKFVFVIGTQRDCTIHFAREFTTIDELASHLFLPALRTKKLHHRKHHGKIDLSRSGLGHFRPFQCAFAMSVYPAEADIESAGIYEYTLLARCMRPSSCARARCHARHLRGGASRIRLAWRDAGARSTGIKLARVRGARPIRRVRAAHWLSDSAAMTMCKITTPARARREAQTARWPTFATQYR